MFDPAQLMCMVGVKGSGVVLKPLVAKEKIEIKYAKRKVLKKQVKKKPSPAAPEANQDWAKKVAVEAADKSIRSGQLNSFD